MSSSPPPPFRPSSAENESYRLALTFLSLSGVQNPTPSAPILESPSRTPLSPRMSDSTSDSYIICDSSSDTSPPKRASKSDRRRRRKKGVRKGLSRLEDPPYPFGSQLGSSPILEQRTRSTPYSHAYTREYFDPCPSKRALKVENYEIPRPDPEDVYATTLSAWESIKNLATAFLKDAIDVATARGKTPLGQQVVKGLVVAVVVLKPRWVLSTLNCSYWMLRNPFKMFHHSIYVWVMAQHVLG